MSVFTAQTHFLFFPNFIYFFYSHICLRFENVTLELWTLMGNTICGHNNTISLYFLIYVYHYVCGTILYVPFFRSARLEMPEETVCSNA